MAAPHTATRNDQILYAFYLPHVHAFSISKVKKEDKVHSAWVDDLDVDKKPNKK